MYRTPPPGQIAWLSMPVAAPNTREVDDQEADSASRFITGRGNLHQLDLRAADRGRDRHRLSAAGLRTAADGEARLYRPRHRARPRSSRQEHPVRREIHPADAGVLGASGDRGLDRPHRRLDRQQARGTFALRGRPVGRRRPAERRLPRPAAAQPADPGPEAFRQIRLSFIRSGCSTSCCGLSASSRPSRPPSGARANIPAYDQDDLENVFTPVMRDLQDFLSARLGRRAIRLEIIERVAQCVHVDDPRPLAVPQRDLRARSRGAASADRNPDTSFRNCSRSAPTPR